MTPAGHLAVSYSLGKFSKRLVIPALLIGGLAPDIDFILLPFKFFNRYHRVITHNLLFILFVAFIILLFFKKQDKLRVFFSAFIGGLVHLSIDSVLDNNPANGIGIAWFWPFVKDIYAPFNLISPDKFVAEGWNNLHAMVKGYFRLLLIEIPFILLALFLFTKDKLKNVIKKGS